MPLGHWFLSHAKKTSGITNPRDVDRRAITTLAWSNGFRVSGRGVGLVAPKGMLLSGPGMSHTDMRLVSASDAAAGSY